MGSPDMLTAMAIRSQSDFRNITELFTLNYPSSSLSSYNEKLLRNVRTLIRRKNRPRRLLAICLHFDYSLDLQIREDAVT